ncbi:DEKNAAC103782 [Brettanomyces naardenensis]|uniref:DEKNAAC103782 n=1 Tax=Brettanomyces naardenensis TaxID=13370 RepID=A0A448YP47_BRENA|nr:DEKNAAC103782 [Brettanomyces naardenensis]
MSLKGKTALITGGNSGLGFASAKLLSSHGAKVIIVARREDELKKAASEIGSNAIAIPADVSKVSDIKKLFSTVKKYTDSIDILFANAGVVDDNQPIGEITEESFDRFFSINVKGMLFTVQEALPFLHRGSSVILTSSVVARKGFPNGSVYAATKASNRSFARTWTTDLKDRGIRVNAISPGPILTEGFKAGVPDEEIKGFESSVPLGHVGEPRNIADAVLFLAGDESSFITGADIQVDGGLGQV